MRNDAIKTFLISCGGQAVELDPTERRQFQQSWREVYAQSVKNRIGQWIYRGFDWHTFSYEFSVAISGDEAMSLYQIEKPKEFVLIPEDQKLTAFLCKNCELPDFSGKTLDIYVSPLNLVWTMVFTHEDNLGPYFSRRDWQTH